MERDEYGYNFKLVGVLLKARTVWLYRELIRLGRLPGREARPNGRRRIEVSLETQGRVVNESVYPHKKPPM